jgi:hypothetical protein
VAAGNQALLFGEQTGQGGHGGQGSEVPDHVDSA